MTNTTTHALPTGDTPTDQHGTCAHCAAPVTTQATTGTCYHDVPGFRPLRSCRATSRFLRTRATGTVPASWVATLT